VADCIVYHEPPAAVTADEPLEIPATATEAWRLARLDLRYRRAGASEWLTVPFRRTSTGDWAAVIPGSEVAAPAVEYYIVSQDREGRARNHFASEGQPHRVEVSGLTSEQEEQIRLDRYQGRRHRFAVRSDWSDFGDRSALGWVPNPEDYAAPQTRLRTDDYVETRFDYTYRILGIVHAIHFGVGSLRGHAPELEWRDETDDPRAEGEGKPGFDYGWSGITFEFHRYFAMGLDVYLGGSQFGFDGGGGGFLRIGNTAETHLDLAVDYVSNMGYRAACTFAWDTVPHVPMSLTAEFTDWVYPDDSAGDGVRFWFAASPNVWRGLIFDLRVGYAARHGSNTGGPIVGGGIAYEF
jgi:hypothetical protein